MHGLRKATQIQVSIPKTQILFFGHLCSQILRSQYIHVFALQNLIWYTQKLFMKWVTVQILMSA